MAEFFQERVYVRISIMQKSEEDEKAILESARNISDKIIKKQCNYSAKKNASDVIFYLTRVFGKSLLFEFSFQTQLYSHHIA
ncbi:MAG: hypothetical protein PF690_19100, partial [Deltaproteobacteria bacterium]|nr:hypothetical protein [Deltaproteobacteria bacterium]